MFDVWFQDACKKLLERLDPFIQENPKGKWEDWVRKQNSFTSNSFTFHSDSEIVHKLYYSLRLVY